MYFTYAQNPGCGGYKVDKPGLIVVDTDNAETANAYAEAYGAYFDGTTNGQDCCMDRWRRCLTTLDAFHNFDIIRDLVDREVKKNRKALLVTGCGNVYFYDGANALKSAGEQPSATEVAF